jgi:peptidyl-prolyl cis-trans isomerase D
MALGFMRRHKKWLYVFLWLVIAAFIVLYVPALDPTNQGTAETVMTVGDQRISVAEFRRAYYRQVQFYSRLYQGRLDDAQLKRMGLESQVLQGLVTDRLVRLEADRLGITVSDEAVARTIATSPEYQENGRFIGTAELRRRVELAGMTEKDFTESIRRQLLRQRLQSLVGEAVVVTPSEAEEEFRRRTERVELEYVLVGTERFHDEIEPTDDEVTQHFEDDPERFRIPEKRVVSYVLLDKESLRPFVQVTDRDVARYYQDHRDEFKQEEESCARHILVKVASGEGSEGHSEEEARRIAQTLLERVEAGGDFGAIAKASSEDQGSAANGGDLGCFPYGRMVPEFDDALDKLEPGETSGLVRTSFGFHIIRLESRQEEKTLPLADVEPRVRALVTDEKMSDLGDEKSQAIATALAGGKSLAEAASAEGLEVQQSEPFARDETPPALSSPTLVSRVFEMETGAVEEEGFSVPQGAVFVALDEIQPSRLPELDEVRDEVHDDLVEERARAAARDLAARV